MILARMATTQISTPQGIPKPVQWDILRPTVMGYTTWLGIYLNGVGIGMPRRPIRRAVHTWEEPTLADRQPEALSKVAYSAAALGTIPPNTLGAAIALNLAPFTATAVLVSGVCGIFSWLWSFPFLKAGWHDDGREKSGTDLIIPAR